LLLLYNALGGVQRDPPVEAAFTTSPQHHPKSLLRLRVYRSAKSDCFSTTKRNATAHQVTVAIRGRMMGVEWALTLMA